jgi:hypothetical protein
MNKLNLLFSYANIRENPFFDCMVSAFSDIANVVVDAGSSIALKKGNEVDIDKYIKFCKKNEKKLWGYMQLDSLSSVKQTEVYLKKMVSADLEPIPILMENEGPEKALKLMKYNNRISVLGATNQDFPTADLVRKFNSIYEMSDRKVEIHGMGYTRLANLFDLPLASFDSSTYNAGSRFGRFMRLINGKINSVRFHGVRVEEDLFDAECRKFMSKCGISIKDVNSKKFRQGLDSYLNLAGVFAYLKLVNYSELKGKKCFLCISSYDNLYAIGSVLYANQGDSFNYDKAKSKYKLLTNINKKDKIRFVNELRAIVARGIV